MGKSIAFILIILSLFSFCSKDKPDPPPGNCIIVPEVYGQWRLLYWLGLFTMYPDSGYPDTLTDKSRLIFNTDGTLELQLTYRPVSYEKYNFYITDQADNYKVHLYQSGKYISFFDLIFSIKKDSITTYFPNSKYIWRKIK